MLPSLAMWYMTTKLPNHTLWPPHKTTKLQWGWIKLIPSFGHLSQLITGLGVCVLNNNKSKLVRYKCPFFIKKIHQRTSAWWKHSLAWRAAEENYKQTNRTETNGAWWASLAFPPTTDREARKEKMVSHTLSSDLRSLNGACILLLV